MEERSFKKYIILWLSQGISGLGSSMTGFALVLWAYGQSHSAMSVSLMSFCNYVPYVFLSLFVGGFIDRHKKKTIMLVSDSIAAAFLFAAGGLPLILLIDLASFAFAFCVLLFYITIPEQVQDKAYSSPFAGIAQGFDFLKKEKGILYIMLTMALINFCSRLTYENILSPMILARSSGNSAVLGIVNACMGAGGIAGGILVSVKKESRHKTAAIYVSAALYFLFWDLLMAVGKNVFWWSAAAVAASLPIPFIMANQNTILYQKIPAAMQGRVFAVRNAIQYSMIPAGIILGGWLADYVFEPFMVSGNRMAGMLGRIVGDNAGSGMAAMFLCTGICGFTVSMISCFNREIRKLN